jgi:hypothetical protein
MKLSSIALVFLASVSAAGATPSPPHWIPVAPLATARADFTTTLLLDQTTLAVGGGSTASGPGQASVERWNPVTRTWSAAGALARPRFAHTATRLHDGRVVVIGGLESFGTPLIAEVEIYDPIANTWTLGAPIPVPRVFHAAVLLRDGRVMVVGGDGPGTGDTATAYVYDPTANSWSPAGSMSVAREPGRFGAVVLPDGDVLVAGGYDITTGLSHAAADRYDVATNTWLTLPSLAEARNGNSLEPLPDGRVLVIGGKNGGTIRSSTEVFDPATNSWSSGPSLATARWAHTTHGLGLGQIVALGGRTPAGDTSSCEVFDFATMRWSPFPMLGTPRFKAGSTVVTNLNGPRKVRRLLVIGGHDGVGATAAVEEIVVTLPVDPDPEN